MRKMKYTVTLFNDTGERRWESEDSFYADSDETAKKRLRDRRLDDMYPSAVCADLYNEDCKLIDSQP